MSKESLSRIATADFETTGETNLERDGCVRVWLWSLITLEGKEFYGEDIESFFIKIKELSLTKILFHNLRFDGSFIADYIVRRSDLTYGVDWNVIIDGLGNWFEIRIGIIRIWDSLKKFPGQSVQSVSKMFGIEGKKAKPFFDIYRPVGYKATPEEIEYCLQDSRIMAYAMRRTYEEEHKGMTLSSDAFTDVKKRLNGESKYWLSWRKLLPVLPEALEAFCRLAYKGGWVYCARPGYHFRVKVLDENSMYPFVMKNRPLPYGMGFRRLHPKEDELYIIQLYCEFKLKEGYLPTVQVKNNPLYDPTEYLKETIEPTELTMTSIDWILMQEHYDVTILSDPIYIAFKSKVGLLGDYIDHWIDEKIIATKEHDGARRYLAKRYLNSPYGKMGMRPDRINKIPIYNDEADCVSFYGEEETTEPIYVPYACFVTAWARDIVIRAAQHNYDSFIYADTDSVHIEGEPKPGMWIDDYELGAWKVEGEFFGGKYLRAKTYLHFDESGSIEDVKCAGMPDEVKKTVTLENFEIGSIFEGKMIQKRVPGGVVLHKGTFMIKEKLVGRGWQ